MDQNATPSPEVAFDGALSLGFPGFGTERNKPILFMLNHV